MSFTKQIKEAKGIIKVEIEGFFIERWINLCLQENVDIWDLERLDAGRIRATFDASMLEEVESIAKRTRCHLSLIEKDGIPFLLHRYRHRKLFALLIALVATAITIFNLFVWQIEIQGDFSIPIEEIKTLLANEKIRVGMLKKDLDVNAVKLDMLLQREDLAWVGVSLQGNKVVVEVVEKELVQVDPYQGTVGNIISDKAGIVDHVYVAEGVAKVSKGEQVEQGTLLISGLVESELTGSRYVRAEGEVTLRTTYIEKTKIPWERDLVSKTGNVAISYQLKFQNYTLNLRNKVTNFEKYDTIIKEKIFSLFGRYQTPLALVEERKEEVVVDRVTYTKEQAEELATTMNIEKLNQKIPKTAERVNQYHTTRESDAYLEVETVVQCLEIAGTYEKIEGSGT